MKKHGENEQSFEIDDWDQHWSEFGETAEKAPALKYRRRTIFKLLHLPSSSKPVQMLEIGSGQGGFAKEVLARFPQTRFVGLELSQVGVNIASSRVPNAQFLQRDLLQPTKQDDIPHEFAAQYAICSEVLEHVEDPVTLLKNARPYMADNCNLIVTVPGGPMGAFDKHIGHRKHYDAQLLSAELTASGFKVTNLYEAGFPFFNLYRLSVIARGKNLMKDVSGEPSIAVKCAMSIFDVLFHLNLMRWGYQVVGCATKVS